MREDGIQVKRTRHAVYQSAHHFVWIPHYRKDIFIPSVQDAAKDLIREAGERNEIQVLEMETDGDHIHVFASFPPRLAAAGVMNTLKGYSSRFLREQFPHLKRACGDEQLWARSYYWGTAGNVSAQTIKRYISECQGR